MAEDPLDELYGVKPDEFTALRTRLAAAAKERGDAAAAKQISAARKPTTAAWIVNLIVRRGEAKRRLADLGERLRAAHAAMDGDRIRALSTEQRMLVNDLARAAFDAAQVTDPPGSLRDDVVGTLQAAVADPDVAARLGRLTKAERWSGFGEFGDTTPVFSATRSSKAKTTREPAPQPPAEIDDEAKAARHQRETARASVAAAERAKAEADDALSERQAELATARLRHDDARSRLQDAEAKLRAAEDAYDGAKHASRDAAELVKEAQARLKQIG